MSASKARREAEAPKTVPGVPLFRPEDFLEDTPKKAPRKLRSANDAPSTATPRTLRAAPKLVRRKRV